MIFRLLAVLCLLCATSFAQDRFKDRVWLWCHVAGAHNDGAPIIFNDLKREKPTIGWLPKRANPFRFHHQFKTSPEEAAKDLGIENVLMVKYNLGPNPGPSPEKFAAYYDEQRFDAFKKVIWSLVSEGGATSVRERENALSVAASKTNICGFIMDDFFARPKGKRPLSPPQLRALRSRIERSLPARAHGRLWVVLYDREVNDPHFEAKFAPWLKEVDGITLWFQGQRPLRRSTMEKTLAKLEWKVARFARKPEILLGCYMWRYLEKKHGEIAPEKMRVQLEFAREHLANGSISGVIFLGSPIIDLAADSPSRNNVNAVKEWIEAHGDDMVGKEKL